MILTLFASFFTMVGFYLLLCVVPLYAERAGGGSFGAGLATAAFMLSTVLAQVGMPRVLARFGYRAVLAAGLLLLGFPAFLYAPLGEAPVILTVTLARGSRRRSWRPASPGPRPSAPCCSSLPSASLPASEGLRYPSLRAGGSGNRGIGEFREERMELGSHSGVLRVRKALEERGFKARVIELERTARSAVEAADALGVRVQQIVKSLVFRGRETGRPVLVLAGGANRVDESKISKLFSEPVEMADAAYVREKTGFSIGGVPPLGHAEQPTTFVDQDLLSEEEVWAAAGHTHAVFGLKPAELVKIAGGRVVAVK